MANIYTKLPPAHNHDQVYAKIGESGVTDHGALTGLEDNDHPQYRLASEAIDHGALSGLADNDHPQYLLTTGKAADSDKLDGVDSTGFVQTSGNQTVDGIKTFTSIPALPSTNPTTANQAARKAYVDNQIGALGIFQSYALQWTAVDVNPSFGNADVSAIYTTFGTLCVLVVGIAMGSTTTYGSGGWRFSLPLPAKFRPGLSFFGVAHLRKSGVANHERVVQLAPTVSPNDIRIFTQMDDGTNVTALNATVPFTWAWGDNIAFQIMYEYDPEA